MKRLAILGSTGSIGTQTLDVVRRNADLFNVYALAANRSIDILVEQAREFMPQVVCLADQTLYPDLRDALRGLPIRVEAGADAIADMVQMDEIDIVVASMVGYAGLRPTINAIKSGKTIALANKETLVVAGELIIDLAKKNGVDILPVDSEHSAIFQCIQGEQHNKIDKILLTASGGPFRKTDISELGSVRAADALKHPNWQMGAKITIDSATMMNKGFEVMEAKWLFGVNVEQIEVVVHPESIIHSAVQFADGSIKAQLGMPDMRLPIQYALTYPDRIDSEYPRVDLFELQKLTFERPDLRKFRNLSLAYEAMRQAGNMPCVVNAANEVVVRAFLDGKIGFVQMSDMIEYAMQNATFIQEPTYDDYVMTDKEVRQLTASAISQL